MSRSMNPSLIESKSDLFNQSGGQSKCLCMVTWTVWWKAQHNTNSFTHWSKQHLCSMLLATYLQLVDDNVQNDWQPIHLIPIQTWSNSKPVIESVTSFLITNFWLINADGSSFRSFQSTSMIHSDQSNRWFIRDNGWDSEIDGRFNMYKT